MKAIATACRRLVSLGCAWKIVRPEGFLDVRWTWIDMHWRESALLAIHFMDLLVSGKTVQSPKSKSCDTSCWLQYFLLATSEVLTGTCGTIFVARTCPAFGDTKSSSSTVQNLDVELSLHRTAFTVYRTGRVQTREGNLDFGWLWSKNIYIPCQIQHMNTSWRLKNVLDDSI